MKTFILLKRVVGDGSCGEFSFEWWEKGELDRKYNQIKLYNEGGGWNTLRTSDVIIETIKAKDWDVIWDDADNIKKTTEYQDLLKDSTNKELKLGWLAPDGKMHYCQYQNHIAYVHIILNSDVPTIEEQGWIHIIKGIGSVSGKRRMTQAQAYTARKELGLKVFDDDILSN